MSTPAAHYNLEDTRIEYAGVMRCCLATVAEEYKGKMVKNGDESECLHCSEKFRLVNLPDREPTMWWKPIWQIEDDAKT